MDPFVLQISSSEAHLVNTQHRSRSERGCLHENRMIGVARCGWGVDSDQQANRFHTIQHVQKQAFGVLRHSCHVKTAQRVS